MWNETITLVDTKIEYVNDVDETTIEMKTEHIPAKFKSVRSSEFYAANSNSVNADIVIEIISGNYNGEKMVIDERTNKKYKIVRTYITKHGEHIELTCSEHLRKGLR